MTDIEAKIEKLNQMVLDGYKLDPSRIKSDYNRELHTREDYSGREILELLQNVVDAFDSKGDNRALVRITGENLEVLNTGGEFSVEGGVDSLRVTDNSRKEGESYIGNKGLGFRAVLNWAEKIQIFSKNGLKIEYSATQTRQFFEENGLTGQFAVLTYAKVLAEMADLGGYATRIIIKMKPNKMKALEYQLNEIDEGTLLFLPKINELKIDNNGKITTYEKEYLNVGRVAARVKIKIDGVANEYEIHRVSGVIEPSEEIEEAVRYECKVVYDPNITPEKNCLYSYFRTDIPMPIKWHVHATLELTSNRNELVKTAANREVLKILTRFLFAKAQEVCTTTQDGWAVAESLTPVREFDNDLDVLDWNFAENYLAEFCQAEILPRKFGGFISHEAGPSHLYTRLGEHIEETKTTRRNFQNLFLENIPEATFDYLSNGVERPYDLPSYDLVYDYFEHEWRRSDSVLVRVMAEVACLIFDEYGSIDYANQFKWPNLFVVENGRTTVRNDKLYLPSDGEKITPPNFIQVRFVAQEQIAEVFNHYGLDETASLAENLQKSEFFRAYPFKINNIDNILRQAADKLSRLEAEGRVKDLKRDLHEYIEYLDGVTDYAAGYDAEKFSVRLMARDGKLRPAEELYLGKEYGAGEVEQLIGADDELFVMGPDYYGLDEATLERVFLHFGVTKGAKTIWQEARFSRQEEKYRDFLRFEQILAAETSVLFKWLFNDVFINLTAENIKKAETVRADLYLDRDYSYIYERIRQAKIIKVDGMEYSIAEAIGYEALGTAVLGVLGIDFEKYFREIGVPVTSVQLENFLKLFKIPNNFVELPAETIYQILLKLPEFDDGKIARRIYSDIAQSSIDQPDLDVFNQRVRVEFLQNGQIYTNHGFVPVAEAYYTIHPVAKRVADKLNFAEIGYRSSSKRIKNWLGVERFNEKDTKLMGEPQVYTELEAEFAADFEDLRKYFLANRLEEVKDDVTMRQQVNYAKALQVKPVVSARIDFKGVMLTLDDFDYVFHEGVYYLVVPVKYSTMGDLRGDGDYGGTMIDIIQAGFNLSGGFEDLGRMILLRPEERLKDYKKTNKNLEFLEQARKLLYREEQTEEQSEDFWQLNLENLNKVKNSLWQGPKPVYEYSLYRSLLEASADEQAKYLERLRNFRAYYFGGDSLSETEVESMRQSEWTETDLRLVIKRVFPEIDYGVQLVDTQRVGIETKLRLVQEFKEEPGFDKNALEKFLSGSLENDSLLRFGNLKVLEGRLRKYLERLPQPKTVAEKQAEIAEVALRTGAIVESAVPADKTKPRRSGGGFGGSTQATYESNVKRGGWAEFAVYQKLVALVGADKVSWVSSYAKSEEYTGQSTNLDVDDGLGYDLRYIDDKEKVHYVEVKSILRDDRTVKFEWSENEYDFAYKHEDDYDLFVVRMQNDEEAEEIIVHEKFMKDLGKLVMERQLKYKVRFQEELNTGVAAIDG